MAQVALRQELETPRSVKPARENHHELLMKTRFPPLVWR
ncbi:hypothetical protein ECP03052936_1005 [Escherichia coli p0305293.6]|nr:hypothetical protein ECP03052936_1005 [Escherichia coli p0305293.6]